MKIQLPGFVIADLYKNSLVITEEVVVADKVVAKEQPQTFAEIEEPTFRETEELQAAPAFYLGGNERGITVLVHDPKQRFLDDQSLQLLTNMLGALQLSLNDIALLNTHRSQFSFKEISTQFSTRICLLFGVSTQDVQLPFRMPDYKVQNYDGCKFLCSASLDKMKGDGKEAKLEKTKLWMCLKTLFE